MPFPLHKSPRGLLELFRLRTLGAAPPQFGDSVLPVTDVTEFYADANKAVSPATQTVGAIGGSGMVTLLTLTGPIRLHGVGGRFSCGAAAATNVTITVFLTTTAVPLGIPLASRFFAAVNAGATVGVGTPIHPIVLPPSSGWTITARVQGTAAGADHAIQVSGLIDNITAQAP